MCAFDSEKSGRQLCGMKTSRSSRESTATGVSDASNLEGFRRAQPSGSTTSQNEGMVVAPRHHNHPLIALIQMCRLANDQIVLTIRASPCPPPPHSAAAPVPPPRRASSFKMVRTMRVPDIPIG